MDIGLDNKQSPAYIASTTLVSEPGVWVQSLNNLVSFLPPSYLLTVPLSFFCLYLSSGNLLSVILSVGGHICLAGGSDKSAFFQNLASKTDCNPPRHTYALQSSTSATSVQVQPDGETWCRDMELILDSEVKIIKKKNE